MRAETGLTQTANKSEALKRAPLTLYFLSTPAHHPVGCNGILTGTFLRAAQQLQKSVEIDFRVFTLDIPEP